MEDITKDTLIEEIKKLITCDGSTTDINQNYLEYFELDELISIKDELLNKKTNQKDHLEPFLDDIFKSCS